MKTRTRTITIKVVVEEREFKNTQRFIDTDIEQYLINDIKEIFNITESVDVEISED